MPQSTKAFKFQWGDFAVDPLFEDYYPSPPTLLKYQSGNNSIGGLFDRDNIWQRYAKQLDRTYREYDEGIRAEFTMDFSGHEQYALMEIGFSNTSSNGSNHKASNALIWRRYCNDPGSAGYAQLFIADNNGNLYGASYTFNHPGSTKFQVILWWDHLTKELHFEIWDYGYNNLLLEGFLALPAGEEIYLDTFGCFGYGGDNKQFDMYGYIYDLNLIEDVSAAPGATRERSIVSSIKHYPIYDPGKTQDLIISGVASGSWQRRINTPSVLDLDLLNVEQRYNVLFDLGDILSFYLGRDGLLEPNPVVGPGRLKGDLIKEYAPGRCRVAITAFDYLQDLVDKGIWIWKLIDAPFLSRGYTYQPSLTTYTEQPTWRLDDSGWAGPEREVDAASYFGSDVRFNGVRVEVKATSTGRTVVWEYWSYVSQDWMPLDVYVDDTNNFMINNTNNVYWRRPSDWGPYNLYPDNQERYWVRARTTIIGNPKYELDFVKILNDYQNQYVEFAIIDIIESLKGQPLKTNYVRTPLPSVIMGDHNLPTTSGGTCLAFIQALTKLAFIDRYPYGAPLPYMFYQEGDEFIWMPTPDPAERFSYVDLILGQNLISIKEIKHSDIMANEIIRSGDGVSSTLMGRPSLMQHGFMRTYSSNSDEDDQGVIRDQNLTIAMERRGPARTLEANVIGLYSIPLGCIVGVKGAGDLDGKYLVRESNGSFGAGGVEHTLILGDRRITILDAIDGS